MWASTIKLRRDFIIQPPPYQPYYNIPPTHSAYPPAPVYNERVIAAPRLVGDAPVQNDSDWDDGGYSMVYEGKRDVMMTSSEMRQMKKFPW